MAFKPNYRQARLERERARAAKRAQKAEGKAGKAAPSTPETDAEAQIDAPAQSGEQFKSSD
ncbi:MAG: hypothetical protein WCF16_13575 [Alphaproteobacteria bacterium]